MPDAPAGVEPGTPPRDPPTLPARELVCEDNLDNDEDTRTDCDDDDCLAEAACALGPPLDRTIAPSFSDSVRFLYDGQHAVQLDADPDAFDAMRISVLRGRVLNREGMPVDGVRVAVHGQDAFGYTETRQGGVFDLVVNGGGPVIVSYAAPGFLPVQRTLDTDHRQYHWLPDVVLTSRDAAVTEIVPGAAEVQVARGSVQEDEDGARQATMVFPVGTQATAVLPDGSEVALDTMRVRATEYTTGERGREAMPGTLPPTSGYTYAVELSVNEADAMGASSVVFDRPVGFYLENFKGFGVGTTVPLGYYDRERAAWVPSDSGVVLAIMDELDGLAKIDLDGDGIAEDDEALAAASISVEERVELGGWCFSPKNGESESKSSMIPRVVFRKNEKSTSLLGGWCFSPKNGESESKSSMIPRVVFRKNEKSTSLLVRRSRSSSPDRREGSLKAAFRDGTGVCSPAPGGGYRLRASPPATCSLRGPDPAPLASPP